MMEITLAARQPFSFYSVVHSHGWVQMAPFRFDEERKLLHYVTRLESGRVLELCMGETPDGVRVLLDHTLNPSEQEEVAALVRWMLALDQDLSAFYDAVEKEPKLAHVRSKAQGRVLRSATLFEDVIKTVLTTNTLWAATKRMNSNLIEQFGEVLPEDPTRRAFPTAQKLAAATEETLRAETRLGYRAPYVLAIARTVAAGEIDLESLKNNGLPTPELRKKLLGLKGIGGYAAANLLMILGRSDYLPVDSWAMKMVSQEWYNGEPVTAKQVEEAFAHWGEWKGMAYWFWNWTPWEGAKTENDASA